MITAITIWEDRISPVFDSAQAALLFDLNEHSMQQKQHIELPDDFIQKKIEHLAQHDVKILICGAISETASNIVLNNGIVLYPFITGQIDTIIECLCNGTFPDSRFRMPGCSCQGRKCRRGNRLKRHKHKFD